MRMNKAIKLLFGFATLLPLAYVIFLFISLFLHFTSLIFGIPERNIFVEWFNTLLVMHIGAMLWILILTVIYMVNIVKNPALKNELKAIWAVAVVIVNVFAMPVYWYLYIWRAEKELTVGSTELKSIANAGAVWDNQKTARVHEKEHVPPSQPPDSR